MHFLAIFSLVLSFSSVCFSQGCASGQYGAGNGYVPKCYTRLELAFVIDGSHSITAQNFARCLAFVKEIVSYFEVLDTLTRVGVISYSNNAHVQMKFGDSTSLKKVLDAVDGVTHHNSGTKTGNAIAEAGKELFSQSRQKVRKVLIVLTDGQSSDNSVVPANALKRTGVEIFAIGVGNAYLKQELIAIATDGRHVFTSGFKSLKAIEKTIKDMVCEPPIVTYKSQCQCCGDLYTYTQNDVKEGFPPCKC